LFERDLSGHIDMKLAVLSDFTIHAVINRYLDERRTGTI
jgi:hypothetical protein